MLAFQALLSGDVEAVVNDLPVTQGYIAANPTAGIRIIEGLLTSEQYGIAVNKNKPELLESINKGLAAIKESGEYDKIYDKWITAGK